MLVVMEFCVVIFSKDCLNMGDISISSTENDSYVSDRYQKPSKSSINLLLLFFPSTSHAEPFVPP